MNTAEAVVTCSNQACPISTFHLTCLKVQMVPNKWFCPLCQKTTAARNAKSKDKQTKEILDEALNWNAYVSAKRSHCLQTNS